MKPEQMDQILVAASKAFDAGMRRLNPMAIAEIRTSLLIHLDPLREARRRLGDGGLNGWNQEVRTGLLRACDFLQHAIRNFGDEEDLQAAYISALRSARKHCRALEALYPLCGVFPEVNRYFLEPGAADVLPVAMTLPEGTGLVHDDVSQNAHTRGGYSLYVPEAATPKSGWPLVVALHGGYSHGRDFIWTWITEARSRGFVVFAPTSQGMTWSIADVDFDGELLKCHLEQVCSRFHIDRSRMLLTGMSDGGTFALAMGIAGNGAYPAIAPVCSALPPVDLSRAKGKRILWVHGAQDWIFPVGWTIQACRELLQAGADIKLKVIDDLSHTYPREANDTILKWFGISGDRRQSAGEMTAGKGKI
ncbi:MAG: phospholipase [Deltaproteobacteria bacterium]